MNFPGSKDCPLALYSWEARRLAGQLRGLWYVIIPDRLPMADDTVEPVTVYDPNGNPTTLEDEKRHDTRN